MIRKVIVWGPTAFWVAVLFFLSEWESPDVRVHRWGDELVHGSLYTVLGCTLAWARLKGARMSHGALILLGVALGVLDEYHQSFVPGRGPTVGDAIADAIGVAAGYALFMLILARRLSPRPVAST